MDNWKKNLRIWVAPAVAIIGALWLWHNYGSADVWWWPLAIAAIIAAETRLYLKKREKQKVEGN